MNDDHEEDVVYWRKECGYGDWIVIYVVTVIVFSQELKYKNVVTTKGIIGK